jgi:hypothetical protein
MSQQGIVEFVGNLVTFSDFRAEFQADPDGILNNFDLTDDEKASLRQLKDKDLGSLSAQDIADSLGGVGAGSNIAVNRVRV